MREGFVLYRGSGDRGRNLRMLAGDMGERFPEHSSEKMRVMEKQLG